MSITLQGKKIGKLYLEGHKLQQIWTEGNKIYDSRKVEDNRPVMVLNIISPDDGVIDFSYILGYDTNLEYTENATLDWGDGSKIVQITGNEYSTNADKLQHIYTRSNTNYKITIKGKIKWHGIMDTDTIPTNTRNAIISIELPTNDSPIQFITDCGFYTFRNLQSIPVGLFDKCTAVTTFYCCFYSCNALTSIPTGLFNNCTAVTDFSYCFPSCYKLKSIPSGLFDKCTKVKTFADCFYGCNQLTSIPIGLFDKCTEVTTFANCFEHNFALTNIPTGLFDKCTEVTDFTQCFDECRALTSIPAGLFDKCAAVRTFVMCFYNCAAVTSTLPTLWISHSSASPTRCFNYCDKALNYADAYNAGWADAPIPLAKMVLNIVSPSDGFVDFSYILGNDTNLEYTRNATLDWGDGSDVVQINGNEWIAAKSKLQHTYSRKNTNYKITIKGNIKWSGASLTTYIPTNTRNAVISIELPNNDSPIQFITVYGFLSYSSLQSITAELFDKCTEVTTFASCFSNCTKLQSIPEKLFDKCTKVTDFQNCFYNCTELTSIPSGLFNNCTTVTNFSYCFYNCAAVTSTLPTLWISHSSALHNRCFNNCDDAPNYEDAYNVGWADVPVSKPEMILDIVSPSDGVVDFSYILGNDTNLEYTRNATLDWGDGSDVVQINGNEYTADNTKLQHTYSNKATNYKITIKGKIKWSGSRFSDTNANYNTRVAVISIELPNNNSPIQFITAYGFCSFSKLQLIPQGLFDKCTAVTDFLSCFQSCLQLKSIPAGLFDNCTAVMTFQSCFTNCSKLTSIPAGLFDNCTAVMTFQSCFSNCSYLTSIPAGLFDKCTEVTDFSSCFYSCGALKSIPAGLFDNCTAVMTFQSCFANCTELTSIPARLFNNCTKVTTFQACFSSCIRLTSIPTGLFGNCTAVTTFRECFTRCSRLTSISAGLFNKCTAVKEFYSCFYNCSTLTSIPAGLFDNCTAVTTFQACFTNCSTITGLLPTLWISHSSAIHVSCFSNCTNASNYADAQTAGWA